MGMDRIRIGTSGWSYSHWEERFYPKGLSSSRWLEYYGQHFNTVEINSTFYRMPLEKTIIKWAGLVPQGFLFATKINRMITHIKRLKDMGGPLREFLGLCEKLQEHRGPLLAQLPPGLKKDIHLLKDFLDNIPHEYMVAIEFRNETWFDEGTYDLLRDRNILFCWHDYGNMEVPHIITADSIYIRMHGPSGRYYGSYSYEKLKSLADMIRALELEGGCFVYFNNDYEGHAIENAMALRELLIAP